MNYKNIINIIGKVLQIEAILLLLPLLVGAIYKESWDTTLFAFFITALGSFVVGVLLNIPKPKSKKILPRSSFIIVALSWIVVAMVGALPLVISREIPNFFDAFFEMSSGFTTTGASICTDVESLSHSILFWRSFSHWIGGMGVIVFILAILPDDKEGSNMHILRAESPGPSVGKLVSKVSATARILYLIYIGLTIIEFLFLFLGPDKKMDLFNSICITLGTAGTGGFSVLNSGCAAYSIYSQYVISIFMILFGINFTLFYLLLIGKFKSVWKNEELRTYITLVLGSTFFIAITLFVKKIPEYSNFEECFRHSLFQVASIVSTTGYVTTDYSLYWPPVCLMVIILLMLTGPCAGSTGGGIKISRINLLFKSIVQKVRTMINPRKVELIKDSGQIVDDEVVKGAEIFIILYVALLFFVTFVISFDGFDLVTNFTATLSCISNVGPGLNVVGPTGNFAEFSNFSKFVLSLTMITGRLELFPMIALFAPRTWRTK